MNAAPASSSSKPMIASLPPGRDMDTHLRCLKELWKKCREDVSFSHKYSLDQYTPTLKVVDPGKGCG
ncbi:MAG: hypothetical protein J7K46_00830 [Bacteroidales bacterium]|nr:hypothetical protein [Bacteroidales bacterium]